MLALPENYHHIGDYIELIFGKVSLYREKILETENREPKIIIVDYMNFVRSEQVKNRLRQPDININLSSHPSRTEELEALDGIAEIFNRLKQIVIIVIQENEYANFRLKDYVFVIKTPCKIGNIDCYRDNEIKRDLISKTGENLLYYRMIAHGDIYSYIEINNRVYPVENRFLQEYGIFSRQSWIPIIHETNSRGEVFMRIYDQKSYPKGVFYDNLYWVDTNDPFGVYKNEIDDMTVLAIYYMFCSDKREDNNVVIISGDNYKWKDEFYGYMTYYEIFRQNPCPLQYGVVEIQGNDAIVKLESNPRTRSISLNGNLLH